LIGLIALFTLFFIKEVAVAIDKESLSFAKLKDFSGRFKTYIFSVFILSAGSLPLAVLLLKTQDLGLVLATIPLYYMVYNITYAIFSFAAGKAADKIGDQAVLISGYIFLILGYLVLGYAGGVSSLIIGFALVGLFSALTDGIHRSYTAHLTVEENRSGAYGYLNGISGFGALFAGILGGYLWQHFGSAAALTASALMVFIGLIIFTATQYKKIA
jgi:MFS family permease